MRYVVFAPEFNVPTQSRPGTGGRSCRQHWKVLLARWEQVSPSPESFSVARYWPGRSRGHCYCGCCFAGWKRWLRCSAPPYAITRVANRRAIGRVGTNRVSVNLNVANAVNDNGRYIVARNNVTLPCGQEPMIAESAPRVQPYTDVAIATIR